LRANPAFQKLCEDELDKRIAVLPFENLSDPHDEYFSDGLSEELISALAQITELKVSVAVLRSGLRTGKRNQRLLARN
jgi:TolB-like protein